jgi:methyl-accepting chemotaxis protein
MQSIDAIDKKNCLIKEAVNEQADFSEEINNNIEQIVLESKKTSASSLEIKTSSEVLAELSANLQKLVDQFKINELPPR